MRTRLLLALAVAWLLLPCAEPPAQPVSFAPLVKAQRSKVVHINTRGETEPPEEVEQLAPFRAPNPPQGLGTGFIVSPDGYIVTNFHVVSTMRDITVTLENGRKLRADIVGTDAQTDLALIKIAATGLPVAEFGDSDNIEVGDWVIAIGSPLGLNTTVTAGIISAKGRNIFGMDNLAYGEFLQTDAAINPGSSGGPLFDVSGKVIGVNSAVSRRGQGIGFAVPSNLVTQVVAQLREHGRVVRGWLGIVIAELTPDRMALLSLPDGTAGVVVEDVQGEGPAARAGLRRNDVVSVFRDEPLRRVTQLQKLVALSRPGTVAKAQGLRRDPGNGEWKVFLTTVTLGSDPNQNAAELQMAVVQRLGLELAPVPEATRQRLGLAAGIGVLLERVVPGGVGEDVGLQAGDVLLEMNRQEVRGAADVARILETTPPGRFPVLIRRGTQLLYLVINTER